MGCFPQMTYHLGFLFLQLSTFIYVLIFVPVHGHLCGGEDAQ